MRAKNANLFKSQRAVKSSSRMPSRENLEKGPLSRSAQIQAEIPAGLQPGIHGDEYTEETLRIFHHFLAISNRHTQMMPFLDEIVDGIQRVTGCAAAGVRMLDDEGNAPYKAYRGFSRQFYEIESPLSVKSDRCMCIRVIKGIPDPALPFFTPGGSFYINGTTRFLKTISEEMKGKICSVCNQNGYESVALIPINLAGKIIGLIHVADPKENKVSLEEVQMLEGIGRHFANALQRIKAEEARERSEREAKRLAEENALMAEVGRIVGSTLDIGEVYEKFADRVGKLIRFDRIGISIINLRDRTFTFSYAAGPNVPERGIGDAVPLAGTAVEEMMRTRSGMLIQDENMQKFLNRFPPLLPFFRAGVQSLLLVPLISRDRVIGVLNLQLDKPPHYTQADLKRAENVATQIAGAIANARLYSELKEAGKAIRESEERYRLVAENASDVIWTTDGDFNCTYVSPSVQQVFGYSIEEALSLNLKDLLVPSSFTAVRDILRQEKEELSSKSEKPSSAQTFVVENKCKDGNVIWAETKVSFIRNSKGQITQAIAVTRDINERKKAEEALRKKKEEAVRLAHENSLMARIGQVISSTLDIESVYEQFSELVRELIHFDLLIFNVNNPQEDKITVVYITGADIPGRRIGDIVPYKGSVNEEVVRTRSPFFTPQESLAQVAERFPVLRPYCQAGLHSIMAVPLISKDEVIGVLHFMAFKPNAYSQTELNLAEKVANQVAGAIANARLFMERKKAEKEKETLEEQLRQSQKMEAVGRLAGGIAHDFNNLLTVINASSQLALMQLKEWDPLKEKLESIEKAGQRAANLTRQLLAFSRRQVVETKVMDLNLILKDLEKMLRRLIGEDIDLTTVIGEDLGRIKADPGQIEQAILNLVLNARDAMPSGGKLAIETSNVNLDHEYTDTHLEMKPGRYVMLSISDTGVGIKPEIREKIFDPFFTTKERGKGTGLGLSIVYGVVKQCGGDIWVYSEVGQGTIFKIYLPRVDEPLEGANKKIREGEFSEEHETILVVEDEERVRNLAVEILRRYGYTVLEASGGEDAFKLCEQHKEPIHLLLSDVVMPGMSGPDFAQRLKYFYPEIRVLFMSGYTDNALWNHGLLDQGVFFIQKPFSVEGLTGKVRQILIH